MTRASHHGSCGMTTRAAGIQPVDRGGIRHTPVKPKGVVDVMDVTVFDSEVLLDLLGCQRERINELVRLPAAGAPGK